MGEMGQYLGFNYSDMTGMSQYQNYFQTYTVASDQQSWLTNAQFTQAAAPPKSETALAWLDRRVNEVRVAL